MSPPVHKLMLPGLHDHWLFFFNGGISSLGEKLLTETKPLLNLSTLSTLTLCRKQSLSFPHELFYGVGYCDSRAVHKYSFISRAPMGCSRIISALRSAGT